MTNEKKNRWTKNELALIDFHASNQSGEISEDVFVIEKLGLNDKWLIRTKLKEGFWDEVCSRAKYLSKSKFPAILKALCERAVEKDIKAVEMYIKYGQPVSEESEDSEYSVKWEE